MPLAANKVLDVRGIMYRKGQQIAMAKSTFSQASGAHVELRTVSKVDGGKVYVEGANGTGNYRIQKPGNHAILDETKAPSLCMAELGREAVRIISKVAGKGNRPYEHYVNKTAKYVSIKLCMEHLTPKQMAKAIHELEGAHPDRFLAVTNSTANCSAWRGMDSVSWQEPKVLVRFTQA